MSNAAFDKAVVSRFLSTGQTGPEHEATMQRMADWCRIGHDLTEAASPDKRALATQFDSFFLQYEPTTFTGSTYGETLFRIYTELNTYLKINFRDPLAIENVLLTPGAATPDVELLKNPNKNVYMLNTFSLEVFENLIAEKPELYDSEIEYNVIDPFDLATGEYEEFFDYIRVSEWDIFSPTDRVLKQLLDAVKVNGILLFYDASLAGDLYVSGLQMHESPIFPTNNLIVNRADFHTTHIANARGYVIAHKLSSDGIL